MKVLVKLRLYTGGDTPAEAKNIVLEAQATSSLRSVLHNAIHKAKWNGNALRTRSIRKRDADFDEDVDIDEDERPENMARYEVSLEKVSPADNALNPAANAARSLAPRDPPAQLAAAVNVEAPVADIVPPRMDTVDIVVKMLNNRTHKFTVGPFAIETNNRDLRDVPRTHFLWTEPAAALMEHVLQLEYSNLTIAQFKFVFLGRAMRGDKTLAEHRLENGSKIEITL